MIVRKVQDFVMQTLMTIGAVDAVAVAVEMTA